MGRRGVERRQEASRRSGRARRDSAVLAPLRPRGADSVRCREGKRENSGEEEPGVWKKGAEVPVRILGRRDTGSETPCCSHDSHPLRVWLREAERRQRQDQESWPRRRSRALPP